MVENGVSTLSIPSLLKSDDLKVKVRGKRLRGAPSKFSSVSSWGTFQVFINFQLGHLPSFYRFPVRERKPDLYDWQLWKLYRAGLPKAHSTDG